MKKFALLLLAICLIISPISHQVSASETISPSLGTEIFGSVAETEIDANAISMPWKNANVISLNVLGIDQTKIDSTRSRWLLYYDMSTYASGNVLTKDPIVLTNQTSFTGLSYNINDAGSDESETSFPTGFGVYLFKFQYFYINEQTSNEISSKFVEIIPEPITSTPNISSQTVSNSQNQLNGFIFTIDDALFKYCDDRKIDWHVTATLDDNKIWNMEVEEPAINRKGKTFEFMPTFQAEFSVWATATTDTQSFKSKHTVVSSVKPYANVNLVIIISSITIATIFIGLGIGIYFKTKHEKVW